MAKQKAAPETVSHKPLFEWFEADKKNRGALRAAGYTDGRITNWKRRRGIPRGEIEAVAKLMGLTYDQYLARAGEAPTLKQARGAYAVSPEAIAKDAREEILLHLYRGLFQLQQQRLIQGLRALFDANQITRKELGQKPLRGVGDADVERAFGKVPPIRRTSKKPVPKRDLGDAMSDFLPEE